jgi:hypothetical protein
MKVLDTLPKEHQPFLTRSASNRNCYCAYQIYVSTEL